MTPEEKKWIDEASLVELLRVWRFGTAGNPIFQGEAGDYFAKVLRERRSADPQGWTRASKAIGWDP